MNDLPAVPAQQGSLFHYTVEVNLLELPDVCVNPFLMSVGFYRYGLPELMMCNLIHNTASQAMMINAVRQLEKGLSEPRDRGAYVRRVLTSRVFTPFMIQGLTAFKIGDEAPKPSVIRTGIRKLASAEELLLLATIYEEGLENDFLTPEQGAGISMCGISIMEMADERNYLPGEDGYDIRRCSKINTVTTH